MQKTKHEIVIEYIESLDVGEKVSVRQLARQMNISEGTVYRAIKDAENQGLVFSIPKVGTMRIEQVKERSIDSLTYRELSNIVEGSLVCGAEKCDVAPKAFFVASNLEHLKKKNLHASTMLIGEYDETMFTYAYENDFPVMLTGGTGNNLLENSKDIANKMVVITTPYDIFDAIIAINQAIGDRLQKREMVTVADIMITDPYVLHPFDTVEDWYEMSVQTSHHGFPIVDENGVVKGIVSAYEVTGADSDDLMEEIMTRNPVFVHSDALISYLGRLLVLENVELVSVVDNENHLLGVVGLKDFVEAQQTMEKQPHIGDTSDNICMSGVSVVAREPDVILSERLVPYMMDEYGNLSMGTCNIFTSNAAVVAMRVVKNLQAKVYQSSTRFYSEAQAGEEIYVMPLLYEFSGQHHASVRVETIDGRLVAISEIDLLVLES